MAQMKVTTFEELKDRHLGAVGTPERDAYEAEVREAIQTYHIGEAIIERHLKNALEEVKAHKEGRKTLSDARDVVF